MRKEECPLPNPIVTVLAHVVVGLDSSFERMSVVPLLARDARKSAGLDYITFGGGARGRPP